MNPSRAGTVALLFTAMLLSSCVGQRRPKLDTTVFVEVISSLREHYRSNCIYLLYNEQDSSDLGNERFLVGVEKRVWARGGMTAVLPLQTHNLTERRLQCQKNLPLNVVFVSNHSRFQASLRLLSTTYHLSLAKWLLFLDESISSTPHLIDLFFDIDVPFDCEFLALQNLSSGYRITEVYRLSSNHDLQLEPFGSWDPTSGFVGSSEPLFQRRKNLRGLVIKAAAIDEPPITILRRKNGQVYRVDGFFGKVWRVLESRMNFSTLFSVPADLAWGRQRPDGTWDGMVAMIMKKEVQLAVSEFSMTPMRTEVVDFTMPLIYTKNCVFIKFSNDRGVQWLAYMHPFGMRLWAVVAGTIVGLSAYLAVMFRVTRRWSLETGLPFHGSFLYSLFYVLGVFSQQGMYSTLASNTCRVVSLTSYFTAIILFAAYSGGLTSSLAVQKYTMPFQTLQELYDLGVYRLGVLANSGQLNNFDKATESLMQQMYTKLIAPDKDNLPPTIEDGLKRVCDGDRYAFMTSYDVALGLMGEVTCAIIAVQQASYRESLAMGISKDSPYKRLINYNLQALRRNGILQRLRVNEWPARLPRVKSLWESVEIWHVVPTVTVLVAGILAGIVLLVCERQYKVVRRSQKYD